MITAALVAMQTLGFSITGILAFGGIAVGFAAKELISNFFMHLYRPSAKIDGRTWRTRANDDTSTDQLENTGLTTNKSSAKNKASNRHLNKGTNEFILTGLNND